MNLDGLNVIAIVVAAVIFFVLGAVWYSPLLFAKPFIKLRNYIPGEDWQNSGSPIDYLTVLVVDLAAALVLAVLIRNAGAVTLIDGALVGLGVAGGIALTTTWTFTVFSGPPKGLWGLYAGYLMIGFAVMGAILGAWR